MTDHTPSLHNISRSPSCNSTCLMSGRTNKVIPRPEVKTERWAWVRLFRGNDGHAHHSPTRVRSSVRHVPAMITDQIGAAIADVCKVQLLTDNRNRRQCCPHAHGTKSLRHLIHAQIGGIDAASHAAGHHRVRYRHRTFQRTFRARSGWRCRRASSRPCHRQWRINGDRPPGYHPTAGSRPDCLHAHCRCDSGRCTRFHAEHAKEQWSFVIGRFYFSVTIAAVDGTIARPLRRLVMTKYAPLTINHAAEMASAT